jgi:hypothetical protein
VAGVIEISNGRVRRHSVLATPVGGVRRTFVALDGVLPVTALPVDEGLSLAFRLTAGAKSRANLSTELVSPDGTRVFVPYPSLEVLDAGSRDVELPPASFTLRTAGRYTLRLLLNGELQWSEDFEVVSP